MPAEDDDHGFAPAPNEKRFEHARELADDGVLPCGHDADAWRQTSRVRYNQPPNPTDGVLAIRPGECARCGTPIREFYSGEIDGPYLGREEFDPDDADLERRPNARVIDPREDDEDEP